MMITSPMTMTTRHGLPKNRHAEMLRRTPRVLRNPPQRKLGPISIMLGTLRCLIHRAQRGPPQSNNPRLRTSIDLDILKSPNPLVRRRPHLRTLANRQALTLSVRDPREAPPSDQSPSHCRTTQAENPQSSSGCTPVLFGPRYYG